MKKAFFTILLIAAAMVGVAQERDIFEVRMYKVETAEQGAQLDAFMADALVPAYKRMGVKIGAWREYESNSEMRYMLFIYKDITTFQATKNDLWKDSEFLKASKEYFDATQTAPAYTRYDSYLCEGFDDFMKAVPPSEKKGIYEMRIYDSPNEEALQRKLHMFNNGEMQIFRDSDVNLLFFGEVLAGTGMPVLIYMTWYDNIDQRNTNWARFAKSDAWTKMKSNTFYNNATTKTRNVFLVPLKYSMF